MARALLNRLYVFGKFRRGAVLLEFAFAVPVLVLLLYCVMDVPLAYRISMKMQKMSELTAQMIYNVRGKEDRLLTLNDLKQISDAVGVSLTNMRTTKFEGVRAKYPFYLSTYIVCIKGTGDKAFETKWNVHIRNELFSQENNVTAHVNDDMLYSSMSKNQTKFNNVNELKNFSIQKGEIKLIIETVSWYVEDEDVNGNKKNDKNKTTKNNSRGFNSRFYLMSIPGTTKNKAKTFGHKFAVITPLEGMIDENKAPEN